MKWDFLGRDDSIEIYQEDVIDVVAGFPEDFEILRFAHKEYQVTIGNEVYEKSNLDYEFYFYSGTPLDVTATTNSNDWYNDYEAEGFSKGDLYLKSKPFKKSFYKLDFYDSLDSNKQSNSFTVILPTIKGQVGYIDVTSYLLNAKINTPNFSLDYLGTKEGFFLYWLKSRNFVDLDTFYMSIKFFDAKEGVFIRMMTEAQGNLPNKFVFDNEQYFYIKVKLDYNTKTYELFDYVGNRIGNGTPIKLYEYVNP